MQKQKHSGFTIVELLIVIVVIGILAALVLNTFSGVQQRARDSERLSDVKAIAKQIEAYYIDHGEYPSTQQLAPLDADGGQVAAEAWALSNLKGIDVGALRAPSTDSGHRTIIRSTSYHASPTSVQPQPTKDTYVYQPTKADGAVCNSTQYDICARFFIYYFSEADNEVKQIRSLNGP